MGATRMRIITMYMYYAQDLLRINGILDHTKFKYKQAVQELDDITHKLHALQQENKKLKEQAQDMNKGVYDRVQQMNLQAHAKLMRLAEAQFKMFDSLDITDTDAGAVAGAEEGENMDGIDTDAGVALGAIVGDDTPSLSDSSSDSVETYEVGGAMGGAARACSRGVKRTMPNFTTQEPPMRRLRSTKSDVTQDVVQPQPYSVANVASAIAAGVPAIFDIDDIDYVKNVITNKLKVDKTKDRTTTRDRATFKQVLEDLNGVKRIEEGVHDPLWTNGTGTEIFHTIFPSKTLMGEAWDSLYFDRNTQPVEVMMVSGDSTKIVAPINDYGGVNTSQKDQIVACHFDDVYNFTFCIYGTKTFLLAPPGAVPCGKGRDKNVNRTVDCSSNIFRKAVVKPGQLIYIPKDWWHEVCVLYI